MIQKAQQNPCPLILVHRILTVAHRLVSARHLGYIMFSAARPDIKQVTRTRQIHRLNKAGLGCAFECAAIELSSISTAGQNVAARSAFDTIWANVAGGQRSGAISKSSATRAYPRLVVPIGS